MLALTRNRRLILETDADLRQHTTIAAARDLEAVRKAIGARQIDPSALVQFYARRSAATLDTTCIARMRPMPFRLSER